MAVLPDEQEIAFPIHGNHGDAGFMVDPAQAGPVALGQSDVFFPDLEDATIINYRHGLFLPLLVLIGFHNGQEMPFEFFLG
jgi:hypothetical protein